ncbi:hypothetical protein WCU81_08535 [Pectobacterium atrosepticum]|uniref:Uncharacterized protein n=1 Tax=Pectobacterium atrosepticum TaxID=29471 RepID=M4GX86_PECAT|nr:hypothetical protein [Pectobacterium atrosepticum]GKV85749.1 hypothetical protein PEC301296_20610 [Pectobacterium carotovorum subsp. carotovorum]AFH56886.1 hypothetical protein KCQ_13205 [Pectobacterium atrosepticum]KMK80460.1 hypothetical protein KCQ_13205 [Pectobacterium atrosepticum ICMP 1526]MCL6389228.1 hypothetical protein [Pectobacterium atrosepticum]MDK9443036.1 hypothetical protein [Pectobacterium atrosepticum]
MMDRLQSSPAVAIDDSAWTRLVAFTPEPACETERLYRLIRHALKALASSTRSEVTTGIFCLPSDGDRTTPLWQQFHLRHENDVIHISLTN